MAVSSDWKYLSASRVKHDESCTKLGPIIMGRKSHGRGNGRASRGGRKGAPWSGAPVGGRRTTAENAGVSRYAQVSNCAVSVAMVHTISAAVSHGCTTCFRVFVTAIVSNTLAASTQPAAIKQNHFRLHVWCLYMPCVPERKCPCFLLLSIAPCREKVKMLPCTSVVSESIVRATAFLK